MGRRELDAPSIFPLGHPRNPKSSKAPAPAAAPAPVLTIEKVATVAPAADEPVTPKPAIPARTSATNDSEETE